jgi:hypothetical protein
VHCNVRDDVKLVRAFGMNADGLWFNPGSEGFFRASYSEMDNVGLNTAVAQKSVN